MLNRKLYVVFDGRLAVIFASITRQVPQVWYISAVAVHSKLRYPFLEYFEGFAHAMRRSLKDDDEDFRIYNVYTNQGLVAFLILSQMEYENEDYVYVDFACSYHLTRGIAKTFVQKLKNSGRKILLDAILETPLKGLKFWWKQGFRTGNAAIDAYLEENLSNESFIYHSKVENILKKAEGFSYKKDYEDNGGKLLKMRYPL